jgi:hypothetical protein
VTSGTSEWLRPLDIGELDGVRAKSWIGVSGLGWTRDAGKASDGVESFGGAGPVFVEGLGSGSADDCA